MKNCLINKNNNNYKKQFKFADLYQLCRGCFVCNKMLVKNDKKKNTVIIQNGQMPLYI